MMTNSKFNHKSWGLMLVLMGAVVASTLAVIHQEWAYPVGQLFATSLPLEQFAKQLQILPTMMVAMLAGGLLSAASLLLQQVVNNTLASDTTLAVGGGANMTMMVVALFLPQWGLYGSFWVAFFGAVLSMAVVFLLSMRAKFNPVSLVLSGLMVNILLHALANLCLVFFSEMAMGVMMWSGGVLTQASWDNALWLSAVSVGLVVALLPLIKPLTLMGLDDATAKSLGVPVHVIRTLTILLVAMVVAVVVARLGVLSFAGLAGATLANILAVRHVGARLGVGFVVGGLLLWLTSNIATLMMPVVGFIIPAGAMTAILGSLIIIYLILKQKSERLDDEKPLAIAQRKAVNFPLFIIMLAVVFGLALVIVPNASGFGLSMDWGLISQFRLPRTLGACAVGMMLAVAGVLLQHLTKNPMASPEVLGVSGGSALGVVAMFLFMPLFGVANTNALIAIGGIGGAMAVLLAVLWLSSRLPSSYLLLVGIAISALTTGVLTLIRLSGDPRLGAVLSWLSGTTYHITPMMSVVLCGCAVACVIVSLMLVRPTNLISLGDTIAMGRGVSVKWYYAILLTLIAVLSAVATLAVGPLSFIGLVIPHLALSLGAVALRSQLLLSALLGSILLVVADYLGRYVIFPYEIPAGTLSAIVGAGYFIYLMTKMK